mmetsp:Transcript_70595/g.147023  ORF Transcript_70595/g.147023 Transcript_70595/m.147023 type:complete len:286 (-) Transcript_70595:88-945(-)|eukprot:CAMPEP_0181307458 /NCGR_PEP_ID=MMETSP1101-20121128/10894_1 /TAXON_ID=46948 /ORGANISM="Rhodomonas abbreviata, Strain Caron Lab Isolate" /LENGTH=285 /DNA_ID=CAMNT_0023413683 /DNA_START=131 /DNA_END=988 /DNA_ORIENTATION=+
MQRSASVVKGIKKLSPCMASNNTILDAEPRTALPLGPERMLARFTNITSTGTEAAIRKAPVDVVPSRGGWGGQDSYLRTKLASQPQKASTYKEAAILALLQLFDASQQMLSSNEEASATAGTPFQTLLKKFARSPRLEETAVDSSTLEEMLRQAEEQEQQTLAQYLEEEIVRPLSTSTVGSVAWKDLDWVSQRSLLSEEDTELNLDALDEMDEIRSVSLGRPIPSGPRRNSDSNVGSLNSVSFSLDGDEFAEYDAHLASVFVKKTGNLARNDACVDLAQLDARLC